MGPRKPGVKVSQIGRPWQKLRLQVIARDTAIARAAGDPVCRLRIPNVCVGDAGPRHVHHVIGADGAPLDATLLITTCAACNLHIGDPRNRARVLADHEIPDWSRGDADD
mgnify:CR=1 FL=1